MFTTSGLVGALYPKARSATKAKGRRDDQEIDIFFPRIEKKFSRPKSSISVQVVVLSLFDRLQHHENVGRIPQKQPQFPKHYSHIFPKQIPTLHKIHFSNDKHKPNRTFSFPFSSQKIHFSILSPSPPKTMGSGSQNPSPTKVAKPSKSSKSSSTKKPSPVKTSPHQPSPRKKSPVKKPPAKPSSQLSAEKKKKSPLASLDKKKKSSQASSDKKKKSPVGDPVGATKFLDQLLEMFPTSWQNDGDGGGGGGGRNPDEIILSSSSEEEGGKGKAGGLVVPDRELQQRHQQLMIEEVQDYVIITPLPPKEHIFPPPPFFSSTYPLSLTIWCGCEFSQNGPTLHPYATSDPSSNPSTPPGGRPTNHAPSPAPVAVMTYNSTTAKTKSTTSSSSRAKKPTSSSRIEKPKPTSSRVEKPKPTSSSSRAKKLPSSSEIEQEPKPKKKETTTTTTTKKKEKTAVVTLETVRNTRSRRAGAEVGFDALDALLEKKRVERRKGGKGLGKGRKEDEW